MAGDKQDWKVGEPRLIEELAPDGINVLLMRRTGNDTVKTAIGSLWPGGQFRGWFGSRMPTHFCKVPPFPRRKP